MNRKQPRGFLALIAGALLMAPLSAQAGFTLEWDPAPAEFGPCDYTVEKSNTNDSPIVWSAIATTSAPVMGFSTNPAPGDQYRLKIRSTLSGIAVTDPNIVKPHPPTSLNFRMRDTFDETASFDNPDNPVRLAAEADRMLDEFRIAIHAPDPDPPSFGLFEAFLASQDRGETPLSPIGSSSPPTLAALFRDS